MPAEPDRERSLFGADSTVETDTGLVRTARRRWRCICADPIRLYEVRGSFDGGRSSATAYYRTRADAEAGVQLMRQRPPDLRTMKPYLTVEIIEHPNPDYSPDCLGDIPVGARYFEYFGETSAYQSGSRYCARCADRAWGLSVEPSREQPS